MKPIVASRSLSSSRGSLPSRAASSAAEGLICLSWKVARALKVPASVCCPSAATVSSSSRSRAIVPSAASSINAVSHPGQNQSQDTLRSRANGAQISSSSTSG